MKVNRNYRFVLTNIPNSMLETGEVRIDSEEITGERIHGMIQESTNLKVWKVQPKRYHKGYCPTICKSQKSAEHEQERLERITGFEWTITVIPE